MLQDPIRALAHPTPLNNVTLYSASMVIPVTGPIIPEGAVAVADGRVVHVGTRRWVLDSLRDEMSEEELHKMQANEKHWHGVMTPGLINAHTHLQYTNMAEVGLGTYSNFRGWEEGFNVVYEDLQNQQKQNPCEQIWKTSAERGARMMVESGTTAAADIVTDLEAVGALASQGLHGISYWEVMGWKNVDWKEAGYSELLSRLSQMMKDGKVPSIGISPHAPYSLETAPFVDLPDIARQLNMRLHIHLAETPMEAGNHADTLSTYSAPDWNASMWSSYNDLKSHGMTASAIQFLDQLGSLGPDVHIAHGVWADGEDRRILRQRGVGVALCPRSNRITVTERDAPIREYMEEGNLLAIGTDSLSSSPSLDVLDDAAKVYDLATAQGYRKDDLTHRIIRMLTLGGASVMGLHVGPQRIGQINAGATADLAFFDIPTDASSPQGIEETLHTFVRHGAGTARATVISGRLAYNKNAF